MERFIESPRYLHSSAQSCVLLRNKYLPTRECAPLMIVSSRYAWGKSYDVENPLQGLPANRYPALLLCSSLL